MRLIFFQKRLDTKSLSSITQKVYRFLNNLIRIGNGKFSVLLGEYWELAVNVLTSNRKISDLIKNNFF